MKQELKHTELRCGNLVYNPYLNEIRTVDYLDIRDHAEKILYTPFEGVELTPEWLDRFGFEKLPHFTVSDSRHIELRTDKYLSIGCAGTPNEMAFIQEFKGKECTDLVCVHNYDFDGPMTIHKLQNLFFALTGRELELKKP